MWRSVDESVRRDVYARNAGLIEEEKEYCDKGNYKHIFDNAPCLKHCVFCLHSVNDDRHQRRYIPIDLSCRVYERCLCVLRSIIAITDHRMITVNTNLILPA